MERNSGEIINKDILLDSTEKNNEGGQKKKTKMFHLKRNTYLIFSNFTEMEFVSCECSLFLLLS